MIPELLNTFDTTLKFVRDAVAGLPDTQRVRKPGGMPNYPAWTLGHLIFSCQEIAAELGAAPWLPEDWGVRFGTGTCTAILPKSPSGK